MLQTAANVSVRRLFFFFQIGVAAIATSSCSLLRDDGRISDPVQEQETASPDPVTIDESKVLAAPSPPAETEPPAVKPDSEQGFYHSLRRGQTLSSVARLHEVPLGRLLKANQITDATKVRAGTRIFIPKSSARAAKESERGASTLQEPIISELAWPLKGPITGRFGPRGKQSRHRGIDIDGQLGDEITAAASGRVIQAGTRRKYGRTIVIEHSDGLSTLYAHMSKVLVRVGDRVERGVPIATVGRSGNARGAHLHFEVRREDGPVDPILHLEKGSLVAISSR